MCAVALSSNPPSNLVAKTLAGDDGKLLDKLYKETMGKGQHL
jgi:hypothetical protein